MKYEKTLKPCCDVAAQQGVKGWKQQVSEGIWLTATPSEAGRLTEGVPRAGARKGLYTPRARRSCGDGVRFPHPPPHSSIPYHYFTACFKVSRIQLDNVIPFSSAAFSKSPYSSALILTGTILLRRCSFGSFGRPAFLLCFSTFELINDCRPNRCLR